ncbi:hypothetical protein QTO34_002589 [Cnephaeus nilssonii]|uniref:Ig-like domain-containing protein n=1 Tax=Cnephaeus nilssonii TaxID=3371016 RepID=A0AA40LLI8_CNENI|nr:hypothetical protein QTO34_002589 [Eptesicus nilssonii]
MLLLHIPLLAVLLAPGDNKDAFQEEISFKVIHSSSFYNRSCVKIRTCLGGQHWQNYIPASLVHGQLDQKEIKELEEYHHALSIEMPNKLHRHARQWQLKYPFEVQATGGCELHPGGAIVAFYQFAYQGSELLHFQNTSWLPSVKDEITAQPMSRVFSQYHVANKINTEDAHKTRGLAVQCPNPGPDRQMLVCHVSGFHPKPIWVKWMRGEQVQQATTEWILPNADGTWYLQVFLEVEATETSGLYCR